MTVAEPRKEYKKKANWAQRPGIDTRTVGEGTAITELAIALEAAALGVKGCAVGTKIDLCFPAPFPAPECSCPPSTALVAGVLRYGGEDSFYHPWSVFLTRQLSHECIATGLAYDMRLDTARFSLTRNNLMQIRLGSFPSALAKQIIVWFQRPFTLSEFTTLAMDADYLTQLKTERQLL